MSGFPSPSIPGARLRDLRPLRRSRREHAMQPVPRGHVFGEFADRPECPLQVRNVEPIAMPADHARGVEHVHLAAGETNTIASASQERLADRDRLCDAHPLEHGPDLLVGLKAISSFVANHGHSTPHRRGSPRPHGRGSL